MDDIKPVNDSSDEMEHSSKGSDDSVSTFQDNSEESSRSPRTHRNEVLNPDSQDELENEQLKGENESELFQLEHSPTDISSGSTTSSPRNSTTEGCRQSMEVEKQQCSAASSEKVHSDKNRPGSSIPLEVEMDIDPPSLDACGRQPPTSSHQPVITDGSSAGARFKSPPGVAASRATKDGVIKSRTSARRISKYASNAQKLLLTVLEEIMKFNEEKNLYRQFSKRLLGIPESPDFIHETGLSMELLNYLQEKEPLINELVTSKLSETIEYRTPKAYEVLIRIVVTALISTVSERTSLNFDSIMANYKALKAFYERFSEFWRHYKVENIQDVASRSRVVFMKEITQRLLLQTRNAYRELLMHVGEYAEEEILSSYEKKLLEEDKSFLRRRLL